MADRSRAIIKDNFQNFQQFYPFYLKEHSNRTNRRLHLIGTTLVIILFVFSILTQNFSLLVVLPVVGYGFAWVGHFFFEKNKPATFKHPFYSLQGDFQMWWDHVTGRFSF